MIINLDLNKLFKRSKKWPKTNNENTVALALKCNLIYGLTSTSSLSLLMKNETNF